MRKISLNTAMTTTPLTVEDVYDKVNGFVFPLRFKPWLDYTKYDKVANEFMYVEETPDGESGMVAVPTFTIKREGNIMANLTDLTDYYNFNIPILPPEIEGNYFYYSEQKLYFNFDLIETNNQFTVIYKSISDSISLSIELEKFNAKVPRVDSYSMEMIGINVK
mgnify:CR=1 FL=1|tara:strand:+ start:471 stop:962 length:492 start_codon:yes stop_codon:yes gene_type:complete